jgi:hypothetical protein
MDWIPPTPPELTRWRCGHCGSVNSAERYSCRQCGAPMPDEIAAPPSGIHLLRGITPQQWQQAEERYLSPRGSRQTDPFAAQDTPPIRANPKVAGLVIK